MSRLESVPPPSAKARDARTGRRLFYWAAAVFGAHLLLLAFGLLEALDAVDWSSEFQLITGSLGYIVLIWPVLAIMAAVVCVIALKGPLPDEVQRATKISLIGSLALIVIGPVIIFVTLRVSYSLAGW
ncbi:hypothetical protein [Agromyces sp. M3QZ16-3]|uniref:hypothetical protein n=1 Tax=Agromyces sp. M3QZ16-3 TaxID=3447585 RepID=UPI003F6920E6